jgi:hypothetical protein
LKDPLKNSWILKKITCPASYVLGLSIPLLHTIWQEVVTFTLDSCHSGNEHCLCNMVHQNKLVCEVNVLEHLVPLLNWRTSLQLLGVRQSPGSVNMYRGDACTFFALSGLRAQSKNEHVSVSRDISCTMIKGPAKRGWPSGTSTSRMKRSRS